MRAVFNTKSFEKTMKNIVDYSLGFVDGVQQGKKVMLHKLGEATETALYAYIDMEARSNPAALQHVYEWHMAGNPTQRLFDLSYTVSNLGLSFKSQFVRSESVSSTSDVPFYNKAQIMESGRTITIRPKNSQVLAFEIDGEMVFTPNPVTITDPGGPDAEGSFERVFDEFMTRYFRQSFLRASGLYDYLNTPKAYKQNLSAGSKGGRSTGQSTGFKWIANATIGVSR